MVKNHPGKVALRNQAKKLRSSHINETSVSFLNEILSLPGFQKAKTVAAYIALAGEPDIADIVKYCHMSKKRVVIPAWDKDSNTYRFALMQPGAITEKGQFDVLEPAEKYWINTEKIDFFLVPGLMFDKSGTRLGHGAGYYDRLLSNRSASSCLAGVAFPWQISEVPLPSEPHDVSMDVVICPKS